MLQNNMAGHRPDINIRWPLFVAMRMKLAPYASIHLQLLEGCQRKISRNLEGYFGDLIIRRHDIPAIMMLVTALEQDQS